MVRFHSFLQVCSGSEMASSSRTKATVRPSCCADKYVPPRVLSDVLCRRPRRIPSASRPTLAAADCCCGLAATLLFGRRRSSFILRAHLLGRFPAAASHFAVFSSASVLATSRHQAPSTDEGIIETVCKSYLCCFEYFPSDNVQNLKLNHTEIVRHCYTNERIYLKINRSF